MIEMAVTNGNGSNFFSSGIRQKVDHLMNILYAGGVNNPMDSIEQISYLLFLRLLSEKDETLATLDKKYARIFSGKWARFAWGNFVTLTGDALFDAIRTAIESLYELPNLSDTGKLLFSRATLKIYDRPTLRAVVQGIDTFDLAPHAGHDFKGDMYEYLLSKLSASGTNGQFRTPRHIINMIVALVDPKPGQHICDPACGTAGFLISALTHILEGHTKPADLKRGIADGSMLKPAQWRFLEEQAFTGYDNDANMVKIAILNLYLHQLEKAHIEMRNALTTGFGGAYPGKMFDCILANPPFAGRVQDESILADLNYKLNTKATELLFLKWFIDHLSPGGRAGVIVPNGVLFGSNNAVTAVREMLLTECQLQAVINLPSGVFRPYAGVATAALIFQKGSPTGSVWFYDLTADGFSLERFAKVGIL
jgi:type I restriction enzyme M protein